MNFVEHVQTIVMVYRIYYKVMTTQLNRRAIVKVLNMKLYYYNTTPEVLKPMFPKNSNGTRSLKMGIGNQKRY